jgi:signal transduction histidine kinase
MLSAEFADELRAARRRVAVLEEANQAIRESIDRITRLSSFSEGLDRSVSIGEVADLLFEEVRGILPLENLLLALVDSTGQEFRPVKVDPAGIAALAAQELAAQVASGMFGWAVGLRRPTTVAAAHLGTHLILVPLATARRTVGMLMVGTPLTAGAVEQQHLTLAAVVARQAAECIDNLWLAEDIRRQHEAGRLAAEAAAARRLADLGLLVETAGAVSATLERDTALRILVDATCRHLGVTTVAISLLEESKQFVMAHSAGLADGVCTAPACGTAHACPLGLVVRQRAPLAISEAAIDARAAACPLVCGNRVASFVGVPLVARDQVLGVLSIMTDTAREFSVEEIALLTGLAAQGASVIENARLFADVQGRMEQQQQALARLVQSAHLASVGLLAGGVAHDINNPLCIISNHLQLLRLRKSEIPVEVEEALGSIETSVRRIAGSIEALLEYARVQPGERQPTDLNEAMRRILVLLQYHPLCRRLSVVTDLEAALPMVDLDRAAWEQVMLELVTNAREAMAEGGQVRIETRRVAPEGAPTASQWIQVIVEDDGPGIPPGEMARVFDPFFTTRATKRGMGIGLKICRDIVHEHGGQMRVESGGQTGTRVAILLRAFPAERADGAAGGLRRDQ